MIHTIFAEIDDSIVDTDADAGEQNPSIQTERIISIHRTWSALFVAILWTLTMIMVSAVPALAQTVRLDGNISPEVTQLRPIARAEPQTNLNLSIRFLPRDQDAMDTLLAAQQDPNSSQFHKWLTPEEYTERFGPTAKDFAAVYNWLNASGFQISSGSRREGLIRFTGKIVTAERVFDVRIMTFGDGSKFANTMEPEIPAAFASVIGEILGLHNLGRLETDLRMKHAIVSARTLAPVAKKSRPAFGSSPGLNLAPLGGIDTTFGPTDFYTFYDELPLLQDGDDGSVNGDCIGIFATSNIFSDILTDFTDPAALDYKLAPISLTVDLVQDSDPGVIDPDDGEAYLDIEWSHAVAPGAQIVLYLADRPTVTVQTTEVALSDALGAAVTQNRCGAISISYQTCGESRAFYKKTLNAIFSQAAMQGQSVFVISGDHGADACDEGKRNVNEISASPYVVSVGGTQFEPSYDNNGNDMGYVSESAWNESLQSNAGDNTTTGGGASALFDKPSWQRGSGVPKDGKRDLPDVAMIAGPPFVLEISADNQTNPPSDSPFWGKAGGTSLAAPLWAGISRLIQQQTGTRLGNMNPGIYRLANAGIAQSGFRDATNGNNTYVNEHDKTVKGYSAKPGYDLTTGWGTVDINAFVKAYADQIAPPKSER